MPKKIKALPSAKARKMHVSIPLDAYVALETYQRANDCLRSTAVTVAVDRYFRLTDAPDPAPFHRGRSGPQHVRFLQAFPVELQGKLDRCAAESGTSIGYVVAVAIQECL